MEKTIKKLPESIQNSLKRVTKEQALMLRLTGKRIAIFKFGEQLYVYQLKNSKEAGEIKKVFKNHKCGKCANFCKDGKLCPKVEDFSVETTRRYTRTEIEAVRESKRIEKYPMILKGVECVNSSREWLIVEECSNFHPSKDKEKREVLSKQITESFFEEKASTRFKPIW